MRYPRKLPAGAVHRLYRSSPSSNRPPGGLRGLYLRGNKSHPRRLYFAPLRKCRPRPVRLPAPSGLWPPEQERKAKARGSCGSAKPALAGQAAASDGRCSPPATHAGRGPGPAPGPRPRNGRAGGRSPAVHAALMVPSACRATVGARRQGQSGTGRGGVAPQQVTNRDRPAASLTTPA